MRDAQSERINEARQKVKEAEKAYEAAKVKRDRFAMEKAIDDCWFWESVLERALRS